MLREIATLLSTFLVLPHSSEPISYREPNAVGLMNKLEEAFCRIHGKDEVVNEIEGKVCDGIAAVSICNAYNAKVCYCSEAENQCKVCCKESGQLCKPILDFNLKNPWFRQVSIKELTCDKAALTKQISINYQLCSQGEDGKICDMYRKGNIEIPKICLNSKCFDLDCSIFSIAEDKVEACPCPEPKFNEMCCTSATSGCVPYLSFLRENSAIFDEVLEEGKDICPIDRQCRCTDSVHACHQCCKNTDGTCESVHNPGKPWLILQNGAVCGNKSVCFDGECAATGPFCSDPRNEGKICGLKHRCIVGTCQHICGSENEECICAKPAQECHLCCRVRDAAQPENEICTSKWTDEEPQSFVRKDMPCANQTGFCSNTGVCQTDLIRVGRFFDSGATMKEMSIVMVLLPVTVSIATLLSQSQHISI